MPAPMQNMGGPGVDDLVTTHTLSIWNDKLERENRSKKEWQHRWGPTFGLPSVVSDSEASGRPIATPPDLPLARVGARNVEPSTAAVRYDATVASGLQLGGPPSVRNCARNAGAASVRSQSIASGRSGRTGNSYRTGATSFSGVSLRSMQALSSTSTAVARKELLIERQEQLRRQLAQVELLLKRGAPSTRCSIHSEDWRGDPATQRLEPSEPAIAPPPPPMVPLTIDVNRDSNALKSIAGVGLAAGGRMPRPRLPH